MSKGTVPTWFFSRNPMFADKTVFLCSDGEHLTYSAMWDLQDLILQGVPAGSLLFLLCKNDYIPITVYLGCLQKGCVPLLLPSSIAKEPLHSLMKRYQPEAILLPTERTDPSSSCGKMLWTNFMWSLVATGLQSPILHSDLALLLSTSGSTGSPKLVRLARNNLQSNAESIATYLEITEQDRPITSLPMEYTYGLSVINSHLLKGSSLLITDYGILDIRFWDFFRSAEATSFAGVPNSYTLLKRIGFFDMELPSLTTMTQAGGKLPKELQIEYAKWANTKGIRFFIMYGQTEATARMSYLPPDMCLKKPGSIGQAIPGGSFTLLAESSETCANQPNGELIYSGQNVSLGYAENADDLQKGDENKGILYTGDLAHCDKEGYYYIIGRKKRFVKVSGKRVSLDELEELLNSHISIILSTAEEISSLHLPRPESFLCAGKDDMIYIALICDPVPDSENTKLLTEATLTFLGKQTSLRYSVFHIRFLPKIPRTGSEKINYNAILV